MMTWFVRGLLPVAPRLAGALLLVVAFPLQAQFDPQTRTRVASFDRDIDFFSWESIASAPCWSGSARGDATSIAATYLARVRRAIPDGRAGVVMSRDRLARIRGVTIDQAEVTGRFPGTGVRLVIGEPDQRDSSSATVLLVAGPGVLAHQAFGVRLSGDDSLIVHKEAPLFWGLANEFLDAGIRVVAVDLSDDVQRWPIFPWQDLARRATVLRRRIPDATLATPAMAQVMAALDYAARESPQGVILGGWGDASLIASLLAPDPRVLALLRLAPPLDRPSLRRSALGVRHGPAIFADDCGLSEVALAHFFAPRPLLIAWVSPTDSAGGFEQPPPSVAVADSIAAHYSSLGAADRFRYSPLGTRVAWKGSTHAWLAQQRVVASVRRVGATAPPRLAPVGPYPARRIIDLAFTNNQAAVGDGCSQRALDPTKGSITEYSRRTAALREELRNRLRLNARREPTRWRIDTLGFAPSFVVISYRHTGDANGARGIAAIPRTGSEKAPLVISYNSYDGTIPFLDRRHRAAREYLNSAGAVLAERGYVVLIPSVAPWFPDGGGAVLEARSDDALAAWAHMMAHFVDGLTFALRVLRIDPASTTSYGISFGGEAALLHAAVDVRVRRVLYNNPTSRPNVVYSNPDAAVLATWGTAICEYESALRGPLIAPRSLIWENGLFDINGTDEDLPRAVSEVRDVYSALGAADRFFFLRHGGGHSTRLNASLLDLLYP